MGSNAGPTTTVVAGRERRTEVWAGILEVPAYQEYVSWIMDLRETGQGVPFFEKGPGKGLPLRDCHVICSIYCTFPTRYSGLDLDG